MSNQMRWYICYTAKTALSSFNPGPHAPCVRSKHSESVKYESPDSASNQVRMPVCLSQLQTCETVAHQARSLFARTAGRILVFSLRPSLRLDATCSHAERLACAQQWIQPDTRVCRGIRPRQSHVPASREYVGLYSPRRSWMRKFEKGAYTTCPILVS